MDSRTFSSDDVVSVLMSEEVDDNDKSFAERCDDGGYNYNNLCIAFTSSLM